MAAFLANTRKRCLCRCIPRACFSRCQTPPSPRSLCAHIRWRQLRMVTLPHPAASARSPIQRSPGFLCSCNCSSVMRGRASALFCTPENSSCAHGGISTQSVCRASCKIPSQNRTPNLPYCLLPAQLRVEPASSPCFVSCSYGMVLKLVRDKPFSPAKKVRAFSSFPTGLSGQWRTEWRVLGAAVAP